MGLLAYHHDAIDADTDQIRVLDLLPGCHSMPLKCVIRVVSLGDQPDYEALSYTWGTARTKRTIRVNRHHELSITDNLWKALHRLRHVLIRRTLWADALCIDQSNEKERGHQVSLMGHIYREACLVLIWIGEENRTYKPMPFALGENRAKRMASAIYATYPNWSQRVWTIQEFVHGRKKCICAGRVRLQYDREKFKAMQKYCYPDLQAFLQRLDAIEALRVGRNDLTTVLYNVLFNAKSGLAGIVQASDPRDFVYSLLSLMPREQADLIGSDYSISCAQVFAKATFALIVAHGDLNILGHRCPWRVFSHSKPEGLPGWAIDFSTSFLDRDGPLDREGIFRPSLDLSSQSPVYTVSESVTLDPSFLALRIKCLRLASVAAVVTGVSQGPSGRDILDLVEQAVKLFVQYSPIAPGLGKRKSPGLSEQPFDRFTQQSPVTPCSPIGVDDLPLSHNSSPQEFLHYPALESRSTLPDIIPGKRPATFSNFSLRSFSVTLGSSEGTRHSAAPRRRRLHYASSSLSFVTLPRSRALKLGARSGRDVPASNRRSTLPAGRFSLARHHPGFRASPGFRALSRDSVANDPPKPPSAAELALQRFENSIELTSAVVSSWRHKASLAGAMLPSANSHELATYVKHCVATCNMISLFSLTNGLLGLCPCGMAVDDELVWCSGAQLLLVLGRTSEGLRFRGFAYVYGMTDPVLMEAWKNRAGEVEELVVN